MEQPPDAFPWRRLLVFVGLFTAVLLGTNAFVFATLAHFTALPHAQLAQDVSDALALGFVAATLLGRNHSGLPLRAVYTVSAIWLGFLNYAFFAAVACWLMDGVAALLLPSASRLAMAELGFGLGFLTAMWGLVNAARIRCRHVTVALPHLPAAWKNRTVALISDIHLGHISGPRFVRRIIAKLRALAPDIVLVSGDMFDGTTGGLERLVAPWKEYAPPLGIYFVTGNHDEFADRRQYLAVLAGVGVQILNNEGRLIDGLQLLGIHDGEADNPESFRAVLRGIKIERTSPSILLAHKPENLRIAAEEGVSLQLSGHTHRGQLWPWTLLVARIYREFAYGLHHLQGLQVYTSSGVGTWGPPLRVGTNSEIVLFRFTDATAEVPARPS